MKRSSLYFIAVFSLSILFLGSISLVSCGGGGGGGSSTALSAPSNVMVTRGAAKDTVSWNSVTGAVKYKVYATKSASGARIGAPGGPSVNENTDCDCSWQSMECTADAPAGSICNYCETTNTCADFDHAAADLNESYRVTCVDQDGLESPKSEEATYDDSSSSGGTVSMTDGAKLDIYRSDIVASNGKIHSTMLEVLAME